MFFVVAGTISDMLMYTEEVSFKMTSSRWNEHMDKKKIMLVPVKNEHQLQEVLCNKHKIIWNWTVE